MRSRGKDVQIWRDRKALEEWIWKPISATCQVQEGPKRKDCGKPTVAGYPAMGGGYMALCVDHEKPHHSITQPVEDCRRKVPWPGIRRKGA